MLNVACHSTTVLQQKPTASPGQPAISHVATREHCRRQIGLPIEPHQFLESRQVAHRRIVGVIVPRHEDPADMRIEKSALHRRVHIELGVRVFVVPAVLGRPPQNAALGRSLRQERQHELEDRGRCGRRDGRNSDDSRRRSRRCAASKAPRRVTTARHVTPVQNGGEACEMDQHETDARGIGDVVRCGPACPSCMVAGSSACGSMVHAGRVEGLADGRAACADADWTGASRAMCRRPLRRVRGGGEPPAIWIVAPVMRSMARSAPCSRRIAERYRHAARAGTRGAADAVHVVSPAAPADRS